MPLTTNHLARLSRINSAFSAMPYGAIAHFSRFDLSGRPGEKPAPSAEEALDIVADNLERLAAVLRTVAETNEADRAALNEVRSWIGGARDLAGAIMAATETVSAS